MAKDILPPNHQDRPEWGMLRSLNGIEEDGAFVPPEDVDEASVMLKGLLESAWEKNPLRVLNHLAGKQLRSIAKTFRLSYQETRNFSHDMVSRVENRKALPTTGKNVTNNTITSWDPEKGGLVEFMKGRVNFLAGDMIAENNPTLFAGGIHRDLAFYMQDVYVGSIDEIRKDGRVELSTAGDFVSLKNATGVETDFYDTSDAAGFIDEDSEGSRLDLEESIRDYAVSVMDLEEINPYFTNGTGMPEVFQKMAAPEGPGEDASIQDKEEDLEALDAEDNQVNTGDLDDMMLSKIQEIREQVDSMDMLNPNDAAMSWAIAAMGCENLLGELEPANRVPEMKKIAIDLVENLLAGHEDYEIFREVIEDFDPRENKLSDPEFSDILEEGIKADYRLRYAATADQCKPINPPNEFIPQVSEQMTKFETQEKMDALTNINSLMHGLVKASMDQNSFDPHDPERPDLKLLESIIGEHDIVGFDEASPSQKTYMLAQTHWDKLESQLSELSDHGRDYLQQSIEDFEPSKVSYVTHFRQTLSDMSLDGLLGESPWSAPEQSAAENSFLGIQICNNPNVNDPDAVLESERFERRVTRHHNKEQKAEQERQEKEFQSSAGGFEMLFEM